MKTLLLLLASWLLLAPTPVAGQQAAPVGPRPAGAWRPTELLVITHVNLIDLNAAEVVRDCMVVVRDGLILSVGKWVPAGRAVPRLSGQGLYLVPGLWDGRTNALATAAAEHAALPLYLASGITSIRELPGRRPPGEVAATRQLVASGASAGPRIMPAGPLLDGPPAGSLAPADPRAEGRAQATARLAQEGSGLRPLVGALLPREAYLGVAAAVAAAQLPLGGHVPESVTLAEALAAGQVGFEDLDKLLLACSPHEAQLVAARAACLAGPQPAARLAACISGQQALIAASFSPARCVALAEALVRAHAYVVPALAAHAAALATTWALPDSLRRLVPAELRQQWTDAIGRQQRASAAERASRPALDSVRGRLLAELLRQHVTIVAGSDAGAATPGLLYGAGLVTELELLVAAGLTPAQALRAATLAPAMITGHYNDLGRIEPGYQADMVLLAANPLTDIRHLRQVEAVLQGGHLFDRGALAALVAQAGARPPTAAVRKAARRQPVPSPAAAK